MGGLNSLSGLNNVNVDFRPTVELIKAIEHAKNLSLDGKVYDEAQWKDRGILGMMPDIDQQVTITKSDGKKVKAKHNDNAYVRDFVIRECPSLYKRDFLHLMFAKPQSA